ncbi:endonuclease/exonuclease/phosphatase family protein [Marmoricola sp. URHB0036]|uniref:endonuclease/exonuclease/phosphatase family protein n=1 Tax=Marmoricola sp. URHB0036 TaxID=1298863 RepID=UPI000489FE44|nr:endonuclease/exonuclease/phosphatase family protein [Marmoricola sp. URHB0036]
MKKFAIRLVAPALVAAVSLAPAAAGASVVPGGPLTPSAPQQPRPATPVSVSFNVATFNVVGNSHSRGRGGYRSGAARMKTQVGYLRKHKVQLVGFQELEGTQASSFLRRTKGKWALVGARSRSGKTVDTRNAVAFRKHDFSLVKRSSVPITYFYGKRVNIPLVQLRARSNGKTFWILNTHNPADTHGNAGRWRAESVRRELKRIRKLRSGGATVLFTGDMNAKQDFFCRATRSGVLHSASGGSSGKKCRYPSANGIDWVLGTRDVRFSSWQADTTTRTRGVSDHPIVVARATVRR